jgi:hypothetical protein
MGELAHQIRQADIRSEALDQAFLGIPTAPIVAWPAASGPPLTAAL